MSETIYFANKCGGCENYNGILSDNGTQRGIRLFTSTSLVDCKLGVHTTLIRGCSGFFPIGKIKSCQTCFYCDSANHRCMQGHSLYVQEPCMDHALKDYYESNQEERRGSGGGCFISTVVCEHYGLSDDCMELTTLRHFRDTQLLTDEKFAWLVGEYYRCSPEIERKLKNNQELSVFLYENYLKRIVLMIQGKEVKSKVVDLYLAMFAFAKQKLN